jgi:NAD-reducing hydrogenase small subunit
MLHSAPAGDRPHRPCPQHAPSSGPQRSPTVNSGSGLQPPLVDTKEYPEGVDVCLVEGAVSSDEDLAKIKAIRERTRTLVSFGDCAVTSNVPGMRNPIGPLPLLERAYLENVTDNPQVPSQVVPRLLERALPVHRVVKVDVFLPGCPPSADVIYHTVNELLEGRMPDTAHVARFGA